LSQFGCPTRSKYPKSWCTPRNGGASEHLLLPTQTGPKLPNSVEDRQPDRCSDHDAYADYLQWFADNLIPPERGPAGRTDFRFYVLTDSVVATRSG
jgi:hypothetical protein